MMAGRRIGAAGHDLVLDQAERRQPLVEEAEPLARITGSVHEDAPERQRQALAERAAAGRIDVNAITLLARGRAGIALVDGDCDPRLLQPLREAEPTDAAADDDDLQRPG